MDTIGGQVPRYNRAQRTQRREKVLHAKAKRDGTEPVPLVLHIPHSKVAIPASLKREFVVRHKKLSAHLAASTDHFTDELFDSNLPNTQALIFPISRLAVDPERFERDSLEPMAKRGLGVLYERGHDGNVIRRPINGARREEILAGWYRLHHDWLTQSVDDALAHAPRRASAAPPDTSTCSSMGGERRARALLANGPTRRRSYSVQPVRTT
jgi:hypothetical protein